eukprot:7441894-Lingulodinium_polyedra.AAC.1
MDEVVQRRLYCHRVGLAVGTQREEQFDVRLRLGQPDADRFAETGARGCGASAGAGDHAEW